MNNKYLLTVHKSHRHTLQSEIYCLLSLLQVCHYFLNSVVRGLTLQTPPLGDTKNPASNLEARISSLSPNPMLKRSRKARLVPDFHVLKNGEPAPGKQQVAGETRPILNLAKIKLDYSVFLLQTILMAADGDCDQFFLMASCTSV